MNLVTGATGILGSHVLLSLLQLGLPVRAARRPGSNLHKLRELFLYYSADNEKLFDRIEWTELDVLDYAAVEKCLEDVSVVYHCAGMVSFDPRDRDRLFAVNETGTRNIVNACLHVGSVRLCHASSIGTISDSDRTVIDEEVFWKKSGKESDYALSKYGAEREVWRGMEEGLEAVIVNPGVILSPVYWEQSSGRIFHRSAGGNPFYTTGSSGYISATDVAKAMIALISSRQFGNRYILIEGNYDLRFILGRVQLNFGKSPPTIPVSKRMLVILLFFGRILRIFSSKPPILTKSLINSAYNRQIYSNSRIKSAIDITFEPVPEVIDRICGYYRTVSARRQPSV